MENANANANVNVNVNNKNKNKNKSSNSNSNNIFGIGDDSLFSGYYVIASDVLLQKTTPVIALVYGKIWLLSRSSGYCYMAVGKIAKQLGFSKNAVRDAIDILSGKEIVGSGKSKRKNIYFEPNTSLILDVTPKSHISKKQVRYYAPLQERFEAYIAKYNSIENGEFDLSLEEETEIELLLEMVKRAKTETKTQE